MAPQGSQPIETQRTMVDLLGFSSNQWTAGGSEASQEYSDFAALPATHDTYDTHDASFTKEINNAKLSRFSSRFETSVTGGFQPTERHTTEYVTNRMNIINNSPDVLSDLAIYWIKAMKDIQLEIIDANLSKSLEQAEKFTKVCYLNKSLAAKVKDLEATEPGQDSPNRKFVTVQQEIEKLEEELQIEKRQSAKLERRLKKCKLKPQTMVQTDIVQLRPEKDILLHQVKNRSSKKISLQSELGVFEPVIQRLTTNQSCGTPVPTASQPPPGLFGIHHTSELASGLFRIHGSTEPTPGLSGSNGFSVTSSKLPTYEGNRTLDDVTAFIFPLERHFKNSTQAVEWVRTMGLGKKPVLQLKDDAAVWAMHCFAMCMPI
jgi:hypothetical protein